ncbi:MAG: SDR family oxidoreductase [Chloroflexota bacterium]
MVAPRNRILVTGGGTFTGNHIAAALLAEGADVRVLVRPGAEPLLGHLADEVEWWSGNVWNAASLKGRARGSRMVIHTVGGMSTYPAQGLTYQYINFLSLQNVANMCVTDGAQHIMLISAARAPWLPRGYIQAKRMAENYMARVGLRSTVIRSPILYQRGKPRPLLYRLISVAAALSPFGGRSAPMPVDVFARGVARLAVGDDGGRVIYYAGDLWRQNSREERRGMPYEMPAPPVIVEPPVNEADTRPNQPVS